MSRWLHLGVKESTDGKRFAVVGMWNPSRVEFFRKLVPGARLIDYATMSVAVRWRPTVDDLLAGRPISQKSPAEIADERLRASVARILADGRHIVPTAEIRTGEHAMLVHAGMPAHERLVGKWILVLETRPDRPDWIDAAHATKDGRRNGVSRDRWGGTYTGSLWHVPSRGGDA